MLDEKSALAGNRGKFYRKRQGSYCSKFMYVTKEGEAKAKEFMEKYGIED